MTTLYSTYWGWEGSEAIFDIAVNPSFGDIYSLFSSNPPKVIAFNSNGLFQFEMEYEQFTPTQVYF